MKLIMTYIIVFVVLALIIQGGLFFYSYKMKQKNKRDDVLLKYHIGTRSDLFAALCRQDVPQEDMDKLNAIYVGKQEI